MAEIQMTHTEVQQFMLRGKTYTQAELPLEQYARIPGTSRPTPALSRWRKAKFEAIEAQRPMALLHTYRRGKEPTVRRNKTRHSDVFRGAARYHAHLKNANDDIDMKCLQDPVIAAGRNGRPGLPKSRITPQYGTSLDPRGLYDAGVLSTYSSELLGV